MTLLISNADLNGKSVDVRITGETITAIGPELSRLATDDLWPAAGGGLIPGLHDHHVHLLAMAAAQSSVVCGPPEILDRQQLHRVLADQDERLGAQGWIRGVGYHESVAGVLNRHVLDEFVADRPVRVQDRGGALWILNSRGVAELGLSDACDPGIERDASGRANGRIWRGDDLMRRSRSLELPDLRAIGSQLISLGITGVTDATPDLDPVALAHLRAAVDRGDLPPIVMSLGVPDDWEDDVILQGPRKILLHDHDLPSLAELVELIRHTHDCQRAVAVHCVTRESLLLTLAALDDAGHLRGDRIEHASVVPAEAVRIISDHGIAVVTQPSFITDRGDTYLREVDERDHCALYPYASLCASGVAIAPSSDAPFGDPDPWQAMQAAAARRTRTGAIVGRPERVSAQAVLDGYLSLPTDPGGPSRSLAVGGPANLCVLGLPVREALRSPTRGCVQLTVANGRLYPMS